MHFDSVPMLASARLAFRTSYTSRTAKMGAIVKKSSGPVDTSARVKALRQLMKQEGVEA
jgi:hypothetical protein